eukprot:gene6133-1096_t
MAAPSWWRAEYNAHLVVSHNAHNTRRARASAGDEGGAGLAVPSTPGNGVTPLGDALCPAPPKISTAPHAGAAWQFQRGQFQGLQCSSAPDANGPPAQPPATATATAPCHGLHPGSPPPRRAFDQCRVPPTPFPLRPPCRLSL